MAFSRFDIDKYKSQFKGGIRQYLFYVDITFPPSIGGAMDLEKFGFYVKSTSVPSYEHSQETSYFMGHEYKSAGLLKFNDWSVNFNIDRNVAVIKHLYKWKKIMYDPETGIFGNTKDYMVDQHLSLLDFENGDRICTYNLINAWPSNVGDITLDYSSNEVATVEVTFSFQYFTIE